MRWFRGFLRGAGLLLACGLVGATVQESLCSYPLETANRNATAEAKAILNYLHSLPAREAERVVSGQSIGNPHPGIRDAYEQVVVGLHKETGEWVGMIGADYDRLAEGETVELSVVNEILIDYWRHGGLVTVNWHARNPWTGGSTRDQTVKGNFLDLLTPGTPVNQTWMQQLDRVADALEQLQQAGVVVLWRPLHEANGKSFWWAQPRTTEEQVALWRHMFQYFTQERRLDNLLWVYSVVTQKNKRIRPALAHYPGDGYVDVVGVDIYSPTLTISKEYKAFKALGKPMGLTEFGPFKGKDLDMADTYDYTELISQIRKNYPQLTFFQAWNSVWSMVQQLNADLLLADPWVVNRDELDWR